MTTEREMLELAAKACGIELEFRKSGLCVIKGKGSMGPAWSPLTDDGDCARMEAQLGICIDWCDEMVCSCTVVDEDGNYISKDVYFKDHAGDKNAARRAASVAVAAEIGRMV